MIYDAERERRDAATSAAHDEHVNRTGENRVLVRAVNGELVSYSREEYGVGRTGIGPKISTHWGHLIYVLLIAGVIVLFLSLSIRAFLGFGEPLSPWFLIVPGLFVLLEIYAVKNLRREWRAHQLRKERGLPRPAR